MDDPFAPRPVEFAAALRRVRVAAWLALWPLPMLAGWWVLFWRGRGVAPATSTEHWETALTGWVPGSPFVAVPFAVAVALQWLGPLLCTVGGALILWRCRRDPPRVPAALALAAALAVLAFVASTWVSIGYHWTIDDVTGTQRFSANHSPGVCCGVWNLGLAAWTGWAAIRYAPTLRGNDGAPPA